MPTTVHEWLNLPKLEEILEKEDEILELAIHYVQNGSYPPGPSRDKKRAVRQ